LLSCVLANRPPPLLLLVGQIPCGPGLRDLHRTNPQVPPIRQSQGVLDPQLHRNRVLDCCCRHDRNGLGKKQWYNQGTRSSHPDFGSRAVVSTALAVRRLPRLIDPSLCSRFRLQLPRHPHRIHRLVIFLPCEKTRRSPGPRPSFARCVSIEKWNGRECGL
jgi:hypothetical protein